MFALHQQVDSARHRRRAAAEEAAERMGYKTEPGAAGLWAVAMATAVWVKTPPCLHPSLEEVKPHHGGREVNLQVNGST